jgi:hypothetical protein
MPDAYRWINSIFSAMEYLLCLMCFIIIPKFLCPTFGVHFRGLGEVSFRRGVGGEDVRTSPSPWGALQLCRSLALCKKAGVHLRRLSRRGGRQRTVYAGLSRRGGRQRTVYAGLSRRGGRQRTVYAGVSRRGGTQRTLYAGVSRRGGTQRTFTPGFYLETKKF